MGWVKQRRGNDAPVDIFENEDDSVMRDSFLTKHILVKYSLQFAIGFDSTQRNLKFVNWFLFKTCDLNNVSFRVTCKSLDCTRLSGSRWTVEPRVRERRGNWRYGTWNPKYRERRASCTNPNNKKRTNTYYKPDYSKKNPRDAVAPCIVNKNNKVKYVLFLSKEYVIESSVSSKLVLIVQKLSLFLHLQVNSVIISPKKYVQFRL